MTDRTPGDAGRLVAGGAGGVATAEQLGQVARITRRYAVPLVKPARLRRIAPPGVAGAGLAADRPLDPGARLVDHHAAKARPRERTARFAERAGPGATRGQVPGLAPCLPLEGGSCTHRVA